MHILTTRLKFLSSEVVLGALVTFLSIVAAVSGYQSSMANSQQTDYNMEGLQLLTDANAEYLTANQLIVYDYTSYDGWFVADDDEKADYYEENFSLELEAALAANPEDPFSDAYYTAMHAEPDAMFDEADQLFLVAQQLNKRGDALQLVLLVSAFGLAFAAWGALLKETSDLRPIFALLAIILLISSVVLHLMVPAVAI
jgi:hypothetical protein